MLLNKSESSGRACADLPPKKKRASLATSPFCISMKQKLRFGFLCLFGFRLGTGAFLEQFLGGDLGLFGFGPAASTSSPRAWRSAFVLAAGDIDW
jgi:hypothetical protein